MAIRVPSRHLAVASGALLGALLGGTALYAYARFRERQAAAIGSGTHLVVKSDVGEIARFVVTLVAVVRQLVSLFEPSPAAPPRSTASGEQPS